MGPEGPQGPKGDKGDTGNTGSTGAQGPKGDDGISITGATVDGNGDLILTFSDTSTVNAGHVKGADGIGGSGGSGNSEEVTSAAFPCASGFTNFSNNSIVFKKGNVVTFSIILTIGSDGCNANSLIGTIASEYRPPATIVLPGILAYENNAAPEACGVNVNADGTVRYYGISAG